MTALRGSFPSVVVNTRRSRNARKIKTGNILTKFIAPVRAALLALGFRNGEQNRNPDARHKASGDVN